MVRETDQIAAMEESLEAESASDAELLPSTAAVRRKMYSIAVGIACAAALVGLTAMVAMSDFTPRGHSAKAVPRQLTVRQLLEGHELAEVATDNILAIGGATTADGQPMQRHEIRGKVGESLKKISDLITSQDPEAAKKLDQLPLSDAQKERAMTVLHKFGDSRMVKLSKEVKTAMEEHQKEGGDHEALKARLQRKLFPHMSDLRSLAQELFPGSDRDSIDVPVNKGGWKGDVELDFGAPQSEGRRLTAADVETVGGVAPQARTLLKSLEVELGDAMPKAPARMLSTTASSQPTAAGGAGGSADPSFMDCLMKAMPNPMEVCSCISSNMSDVISMMTGFMKR